MSRAVVSSPRLDRRSRSARAEGGDAREALLRAAAGVFGERGFREASVDEIAARAGYSKGALYWHFHSKDDLFFALMDSSIALPTREMIELLTDAPADQDVSVEASRLFVQLLSGQRDALLLDHEYFSQAARDPELRGRYAAHRAEQRAALGRALLARLARLGAPELGIETEQMATVIMALSAGLAQDRLIDPAAVPDELLGRTIVLIYRGLLASAADGTA